MKIDRFTWIVIGVVLIILVAAVVAVNLTGGSGLGNETYLTENTPAAPVYNAFVAFQQGDTPTARRQYSARVVAENQSQGYNPFIDRFGQSSVRRLRIIEVQFDSANPDLAYVTASLDTYGSSGLFGTGSTWTRRLVLEVIRDPEDTDATGAGLWKLDTAEYFY